MKDFLSGLSLGETLQFMLIGVFTLLVVTYAGVGIVLSYQANDLEGARDCSVDSVELDDNHRIRYRQIEWRASISCPGELPRSVQMMGAPAVTDVVEEMRRAEKDNLTINIDRSIGADAPIFLSRSTIIELTVNEKAPELFIGPMATAHGPDEKATP